MSSHAEAGNNTNVPLDDDWTCVAFLGDTSGSMCHLDTKELAQGVTKMIREQNDDNRSVIFFGARFSNSYQLFSDGVDGKDITITKEDLHPDGMTALVPAFARHIRYVGAKLAAMTERRPGKVIFILVSDGEQTMDHLQNRDETDAPFEGSTGYEKLKELVTEHQDIWNWTFMFLGTNFDSIAVGTQMGINPTSCMNYHYSDVGARNVMRMCSQGMTRVYENAYEGFTDLERNESQIYDGSLSQTTSGPNYYPNPNCDGYEVLEDSDFTPACCEPVVNESVNNEQTDNQPNGYETAEYESTGFE